VCRRIDQIRIGEGWKRLNDVSAEEGLIAIGYERKQKEFRYINQGVGPPQWPGLV
jgi:hypothetical protein